MENGIKEDERLHVSYKKERNNYTGVISETHKIDHEEKSLPNK